MTHYKEQDIKEIGEYLFSQAPQKPDSIQLTFDTNLKNCYQSLLTLFTQGMKKLYGDSRGVVDLPSITEPQIEIMRDYFKSIGFTFTFQVIKLDTNIKIEMKDVKKKLQDYVFRIRVGDLIYIISFDYYNV